MLSSKQVLGRALVVAMVVVQVVAARSGIGVPVFLVLAMVGIVVFGTREKMKNEPSAYSVFNAGHSRLAGQFTAEQFDSQLRGQERPEERFLGVVEGAVPLGPGQRLGGKTAAAAADPDLRRRLQAQAAERRYATTT